MSRKYLLAFTALYLLHATASASEVVIYTSLDQVFSERILQSFEQETGIEVKAVYDVEANKTTGLVNRLIAERSHPRADVFWNSEVGRTLVLKDKGVLAVYRSPSAADIPEQFKDPEGYWTGFAVRARVLIYNTRLLTTDQLPRSIFDLTAPRWSDKVAMSYPLFGTTATQVAAWYAVLGAERTERYLRDLESNGVLIVDGNSVSRDLVVAGEVPLSFTDTDDANVAMRAGKPVKMLFPDRNGIGTLVIPNTVALVDGAPHEQEARRLIDYLLSPEVERRLAFSESMQIPVRDSVPRPPHVPALSAIKAMQVRYRDIAENLERSARFCQELFIR